MQVAILSCESVSFIEQSCCDPISLIIEQLCNFEAFLYRSCATELTCGQNRGFDILFGLHPPY